MSKVDKNQSTYRDSITIHGDRFCEGIPLRLEIAARLLAGVCTGYGYPNNDGDYSARRALEVADSLIRAHNETCEDKP